jgi:hypothetical protein
MPAVGANEIAGHFHEVFYRRANNSSRSPKDYEQEAREKTERFAALSVSSVSFC